MKLLDCKIDFGRRIKRNAVLWDLNNNNSMVMIANAQKIE